MGNKSFDAGMKAGAKPFEDKFQKQADAVEKTADKLDSKLDDIKSVTDTLVDDGLARERKEVFGLNTQYDIKDMDDTEKILVVSLMYALAQKFGANDYQKSYIRSVQKYLELKNIQPVDTLTGVENVKDIDSQKAILQTVMEYLFLESFSFDYLDEEDYEELFDSFNVNRKGFREVENAINNIYQAVGAEGLVEKYVTPQSEETATEVSSNGNPVKEEFRFKMTVKDIFVVKKVGIVVTGVIEAGSIHFHDVIDIECASGRTIQSVVLGIEVSGVLLDSAETGTKVGLLLSEIKRNEIAIGDILTIRN